ncbi:hypothetical protein GAYE_SCF02G2125 [Galdieria yellowstonensis]|uniref:Fucosyltransferase n=1 Tax=Galdieria yellowstonensis TaxID=3028027 RepID=A0AAV9IAA0_9RHOD|nr:hypothetical protein GAYE_SCF02G2125 [Galdieria yellowstonensis]
MMIGGWKKPTGMLLSCRVFQRKWTSFVLFILVLFLVFKLFLFQEPHGGGTAVSGSHFANSSKVVVAYCRGDWARDGLFQLFNISDNRWYFVLEEEPTSATLVAHSAWGTCTGKYPNATKIFIDMEPNTHRGSENHITVSTVRPSDALSTNVLYVPYALWSFAERKAASTSDLLRTYSYSEAEQKFKEKTKFAAFAARYCSRDNKQGETRTRFFDMVSTKYKSVDALGNCRHNVDPPTQVEPPFDNHRDMVISWYRPYKFTLCFENTQLMGYITEKLFNGLLADTVPIYWGTPDIDELVNTDAIIVCNEEGDNTFHSCIDELVALDRNASLWIQKLQAPLFRNGTLPLWLRWNFYSEQLLSMLEKFLQT